MAPLYFHALFSLLVAGLSLAAVRGGTRDNSPGQHMYRFEHSLVNDDEHFYHYLDIHGLVHHHLDVHSLVHRYLNVHRNRYGHRYLGVHRDRFGHHYLNVHSLVNRDDVNPNDDVIDPDQYEYFDIYGFVRHDDHYHHYNPNHDLIDLDQYEYFNEHLRPCLCADHNLMDIPRMLSRQRLLPDPQWVQCFCASSIRSGVTPGGTCNTVCGGGAGTCGGVNAIDIYEAVVGPCVTPWTYRGCYSDNVSARILNGYGGTFSTNSVASCQTTCLNRGYAYAGVEDGSQCFCASSIGSSGTLQGETHCQTPCSGGGGTCGGVDYIAIYETATKT
ncbi:hypothetical protein B0H13DRAFT_2577647 [Mycena leptocephala]|nr:hypothetical protein B0H13DRAFT_2577647 [Mycena leptocephala]